jgi:hypothetical protein
VVRVEERKGENVAVLIRVGLLSMRDGEPRRGQWFPRDKEVRYRVVEPGADDGRPYTMHPPCVAPAQHASKAGRLERGSGTMRRGLIRGPLASAPSSRLNCTGRPSPRSLLTNSAADSPPSQRTGSGLLPPRQVGRLSTDTSCVSVDK